MDSRYILRADSKDYQIIEDKNMINVFQPSLGEEEAEAVKEVMLSNWLGKGKKVQQFEEAFVKHLTLDGKADNAAEITVNNFLTTHCCSEGLFSSMKILDLKDGDEVITPTIGFVGVANAICANGCKMVLCDVDKRTLNVTVENLEKKLTSKTKAIFPLHFGGIPSDMDAIMTFAKDNGLYVIEDSACSVASTYKNKACGTMGDVATWSFDAMKILVCGDGGGLYVKDPERAAWAEKHLYFGLESKSGYSNSVDKKWWEYDVSQFGHRSIMNDITASMAIVQLEKLPKFIARRKEIFELYNELLDDVEWLDRPEDVPDGCTSSYYFYHIQLKNGRRDDLAAFLRKNDIYTTFRYYPLHWVKYYGCEESLPGAEYAALHTLCLPIHQSLSNAEVEYVVSKIKEFGNK